MRRLLFLLFAALLALPLRAQIVNRLKVDDIVKGFNTGADDFITKPIIMEKLLSCVITQMQLVEATRK